MNKELLAWDKAWRQSFLDGQKGMELDIKFLLSIRDTILGEGYDEAVSALNKMIKVKRACVVIRKNSIVTVNKSIDTQRAAEDGEETS